MGGKRAQDSGSESASSRYSDGVSSESAASSSDSGAEETVSMDFATFNVAPHDAPAIRQFLAGALSFAVPGAPDVPLSALADALAEGLSAYVGTAGKQGGEDDDALAVACLVPAASATVSEVANVEGGKAAVEALFALLRASIPKGNKAAKQALDDPAAAVVVHERYMNLPGDVAAPMLRQLLDDAAAAADESAVFAPSVVVLPTPVFRERPPQDQARPQKEGGGASSAGASGAEHSGEWQYFYDEMVLAEDAATARWDVPVRTTHDTADSRRAFSDVGVEVARRILVFTFESFAAFVDQLSSA